MKNLKIELFNIKKNLSYNDDSDIYPIIEKHYNACDSISEKMIILSLNEKLNIYTYNKDIKKLLETLNADMAKYQLLYELKNLYKILTAQNQGMIYRHPINVVLETINLETDEDRLFKIINELSIYDWIPEIKLFVSNLTKNPEKRTNLLCGGKSESVYTIVERVEEGHICLIKGAWFLLAEDTIEKTLLETYIKDPEKLRVMRNLQTALNYATVTENVVSFKITEDLTIGLDVDKKGVIYLNEKEMKETCLENIFESSYIPIIHKNYYPLLLETSKNLDKFNDIDVVKRITNLMNPYLEVYAFNYKKNNYIYRCDERNGTSFYSYGDPLQLVMEIKNDLQYDLTFFYEEKIDKEIILQKKLEDKERQISLKIDSFDKNISKLEMVINNTLDKKDVTLPILTEARDNLLKKKNSLIKESNAIKELKHRNRHIA